MCSIATAYMDDEIISLSTYPAAMQPEQRIIADWMKRQMERLGWKPQQWAIRADVTPTNISRAVKEDYPSITTIKTLDRLAKAAGVTSVLEFLSNQASPHKNINEEKIAMALMALGGVVHSFPSNKDDAQIVAWLFRDTLQFLSDHPEASADDLGYYVRGIVDGSKLSTTSLT